MIISCFHTIGLNVTCLNLPPQRPLQRDTGFDGDTLFDCQIVHPLNPSIVGDTKYSVSPKRSKKGYII